MSENATLKTLKTIYDSSFQQYLKNSKLIGGNLFEQSKHVDNLFKITLEILVELFSKHKTPVNYIIDPITRETKLVNAFETEASELIFSITLISKSVQVFEWVHELDTVKFVETLNKNLIFNKEKAHTEIEEMGQVYCDWLKAWNETYEEFGIFVCNFFKNGIQWTGRDPLPLSHVLGDSPISHNTQQHNKQKKMVVLPKPIRFIKNDKIWHLEGEKHIHNLIINVATKDEHVHLHSCVECTVIIENCIATVQLDSCSKLTLLLKAAVQLDLMRCTSCNLHCFEKVPKIEISSCEACSLYLSENSLDSIIVTTRSTGINVSYPFDDGIYQNFTISDQLYTQLLPNEGIQSTISE